jgi:hypothetical protein
MFLLKEFTTIENEHLVGRVNRIATDVEWLQARGIQAVNRSMADWLETLKIRSTIEDALCAAPRALGSEVLVAGSFSLGFGYRGHVGIGLGSVKYFV